jgi:hypothetical protein
VKRFVLLGASNLTVSFPLIINSLRSHEREPVEILAAHGHGRSYGIRSRFLFRSLPGITKARLWEVLDDLPSSAKTFALLTDVGNDLLYSVTVQQITQWIEQCLQLLRKLDANVVMTELPIDSVLQLTRPRFELTKRLLFSSSKLQYEELPDLIHDLNQQVSRLSNQYGASLIKPVRDWYGFDPIHIRRARRIEAWTAILGQWYRADEQFGMQHASIANAVRLMRLAPDQQTLFGRIVTRQQPAARLGDLMSLWLY